VEIGTMTDKNRFTNWLAMESDVKVTETHAQKLGKEWSRAFQSKIEPILGKISVSKTVETKALVIEDEIANLLQEALQHEKDFMKELNRHEQDAIEYNGVGKSDRDIMHHNTALMFASLYLCYAIIAHLKHRKEQLDLMTKAGKLFGKKGKDDKPKK
tara:strand:+ start:1868 stop:2338 length:471 start_codon:yes stop_codon:yes gene_type:complete